jgi:hypothetical protein
MDGLYSPAPSTGTLLPRREFPVALPSSHDITELLIQLSGGDRAAMDDLLPLIYDEMRRLASRYLRRERADHTLQPTALGRCIVA